MRILSRYRNVGWTLALVLCALSVTFYGPSQAGHTAARYGLSAPAPAPTATAHHHKLLGISYSYAAYLDNVAGREFGVSGYWMHRVQLCESGDYEYAYNSSGASGIDQFLPSTFWYWVYNLWWGRNTWLSPYNPRVATRLMAWMWSRGMASQWVCSYLTGYLYGMPLGARPGAGRWPANCRLPVYHDPPSCWRWLPHPRLGARHR